MVSHICPASCLSICLRLPGLPQAASACLRLPQPASDCLRLPQAALDCLGLPQAASACLRLPQAASACLRLPQTASACGGLESGLRWAWDHRWTHLLILHVAVLYINLYLRQKSFYVRKADLDVWP